MSLINLLIGIIIIGVVLYIISILPIAQPFKIAANVLAALIFLIWLLQALGFVSGVIT